MNYPKNRESALKWNYKFWNTQPVTKLNEIVNIDSQIESNKIISDIPLSLPNDFDWHSLNLTDITDATELITFLDKYYVEDSNNEFRLHYTIDLLNWIYNRQGPNSTSIALGVKVKTNNILVATICGKVINMQVNKKKLV